MIASLEGCSAHTHALAQEVGSAARWQRLPPPDQLAQPPVTFLRERGGRVVGYYLAGIAGHGVAETEDDMLALVREAARQMPPDFHRVFCPLTEGSLYRSFLANGSRAIKVMNLMALGPYERPDGVWVPSVLY